MKPAVKLTPFAVSPIFRDQLIAEARRYMGVKWHHQGRNPKVGMDCVGYMRIVGGRFIQWPCQDRVTYPKMPRKGQLRQALIDHGMVPVPMEEADDGDLWSMWFDFVGYEQHLAMLARDENGRRTIIHTYAHVGRVCEHGIDDSWVDRTMGAWRFPGVV